MSTTSSTLWVAYGAEGSVVGTVRRDGDGYTATIAGADASLGTYPTMEIAKGALHGHLPPGSDWPRFVEH
ncbi:methyltransferase [Microbacterium flavum]|uniref:Methyltransferase n=1 Tax=Microbacterium flavum TaxID=415216 RepID=A0ABS5XZQ5_9MICO|nr:methyltransferase [Microbacterium flavum]MBT8798858.1 methyltransferase [Microbacterium flavum]